jgi:hypothetical protein
MSINRRTFLTGLTAAGAGALLPEIRSLAQTASPSRVFRIDTHTHFSIPKLYDLATARGVQQATLKDWTPAKMLQEMEEGGVQTSIMSISDPGVPARWRASATSSRRRLCATTRPASGSLPCSRFRTSTAR